MKTPLVSDLNSEQNITTFFLVCEKEIRSTREGKPYLRLELGDRSGTIEARMWDQFEAAAKVMHHAYLGGLLEHVVSLCGLAKVVATHYPELDLDLLLTAAILHDVGKLDELCYERAIGYTVEGHLLGHIVMEMETVSRAIDLIEGFPPKLKTVVQHLLISHHGRYEFGSPKLPMIREALVFHYLDDLDSKLAAVRAALEQETGEPEWSAYSGALGRKFLRLEEFLKNFALTPPDKT